MPNDLKQLTDEQLMTWLKQSLSFWRVYKFMVPGGNIITINSPMELIDEIKSRHKPVKKPKKKKRNAKHIQHRKDV